MDNFDTTNNKWQKHEKFIEDLLNLPDKYIWVDKNPQSGFTTSLGKVCVRKGLKFLEIAPYNRIIDDTIAVKVMGGKDYGKIGTNKEMCKNSFPNKFFKRQKIYHINCDSCSLINTDKCGFYKVSHNNYPAYGITYSKLDNILRFPSRMGNCHNDIIKALFEKTDVILMDEFANLITWLPKGFFIDDLNTVIDLINQRKDNLNVSPGIVEHLNKFIEDIKNVKIDKERYGIEYGVYKNEPLKMFGNDDITITAIGIEGERVIKDWAKQTFKTFKDEISCESPLDMLFKIFYSQFCKHQKHQLIRIAPRPKGST